MEDGESSTLSWVHGCSQLVNSYVPEAGSSTKSYPQLVRIDVVERSHSQYHNISIHSAYGHLPHPLLSAQHLPHVEACECPPPRVNMGRGWSNRTRQKSTGPQFHMLHTFPCHQLLEDEETKKLSLVLINTKEVFPVLRHDGRGRHSFPDALVPLLSGRAFQAVR